MSFHFAGLVPDTQYTVTVKGRVPTGICTFTTRQPATAPVRASS